MPGESPRRVAAPDRDDAGGAADGSVGYARIVSDLLGALHRRLVSGPCELFAGDLVIRAEAGAEPFQPDACVVHGESRIEHGLRDVLLNPAAVFEVMSPASEPLDRGRKFAACRRIAALLEYVLVSVDQPLVERYRRQADHSWTLFECRGLDAVLRMETPAIAVPLAEIYRRAPFARTQFGAG